tara:strand:+ start:199 stop:675 length:477 start_codon:yes stop_codon:yes gene_type:complete
MFNSYTKLSDTIQDLLIFALVTFADSGNTVYVERLLNGATNGKRLRANDIKLIIKYVRKFSNIKIEANKDLDGYKLTKQGKKGDAPVFNRPDDSVTWYNLEEVNQAVSTFDLVQIVSTLRKKYKSAKENDKKKVINTVQSEKILQEIDSLLLQLNPIK